MSSITFDSVRKVYGEDTVAIEGFDLEIESGEFLTLVGPSGSGKSTLLRMVAGLEDITDGEIAIGDTVVNYLPPRDRDIAMVFQSYALYPHLDVRDNMAFGLKRSTDLPKEEIDERVEEAASLMGIRDLLDDKPKHLSGGQRQRVATGRAIIRKPAVFLFDEPLSNLDAKLRKHMRTELQRLQQQLDTTSIYVTHNQEEAMTMSDRIAILDQGVLQQVGTPREVYTNPRNLFVAEFIGSPSMNVFSATYRDDGQYGRFEGQLEMDLPEPIPDVALDDGARVNVGVRPEDVDISLEQTPGSVPVYVDIVEPLGRDDLCYFTFQSDTGESVQSEAPANPDADAAEEFKAFVVPESVPEEYESESREVYLSFDMEDVHVFDADSGLNLQYEEQGAGEAKAPATSS